VTVTCYSCAECKQLFREDELFTHSLYGNDQFCADCLKGLAPDPEAFDE
jgi:hypothetical protein